MESELEKILSAAVSGELRDPRLSMLTVTDVKLSPDMSFARVFYTYYDDEVTPEEMQALLTRATGFFKSKIAAAHIMRSIPDIRFVHDATEERAQRIHAIFDTMTQEDMFEEGE